MTTRTVVSPASTRGQRADRDPAQQTGPPLRWWQPAAAFAVAAVVLTGLVIGYGTNAGPLDDPNQAFQRDGGLHNGPLVSAEVGGTAFGGQTVVVLFGRQEPGGTAFRSWASTVTAHGTRLVIAIAGHPGALSLEQAVGMRSPRDGGRPVGYAIVDPQRKVRYATLDPAYEDHASEVTLLTVAISAATS